MENLVGYAKDDVIVPLLTETVAGELVTVSAANQAARAWCAEVNTREHSVICAVPAERLEHERTLLTGLPSLQLRIGPAPVLRTVDRLACVRFGSARYSVPTGLIGSKVAVLAVDGRVHLIVPGTGEVVAEHAAVMPGQASVADEHYGGPRPAPRRAVRPGTAAERAFCALGPVAAAFITGAAAAGSTRLGPELADLEAAHGRPALLAALERAVALKRWHAGDVASILTAGTGLPQPRQPGERLQDWQIDLPVVPTRALSAYALDTVSTSVHLADPISTLAAS